MEKEIVWTETAQNQLEDIYFYLLDVSKSDSISEKIVETIYLSVSILKSNSEIYQLDEMKVNNNENYRAFEIYNYRISYKVDNDYIYILRIRHTSRNPKQF